MLDDENPLLAAARDLVIALADMGLVPTFIGGVAVSLVAEARHTDDLDALIIFDTARAETLLSTLKNHGFSPYEPDMATIARRARLVAVVHEGTRSVVDIALGCMPFEEELIERSTKHSLSGITLQVATPEDLVIMKAVAGRPKDLEDIRSITRVYPDLDRKRIRFWVDQYGELMENPGLWAEIEVLLDGGIS